MYKITFNQGMLRRRLPQNMLLIMKLIVIIMTTCLVQVSAAGFAQKLNFTKRGASLSQIFTEIRKQTGYFVIYSDEQVDDAAKLDVNFKNTDLKDVMDVIGKSQSLDYSFAERNISLKPKEKGFLDNLIARFQAIDVRGKVVDSVGNGLAGATVSVKNGKGSTSTDAGGNFYLKNVDDGAVLVVNYLGYVAKEVVVSNEFLSITLAQSASKLDEVQIQAYGVTSRRLSTGNISTVRAVDIEKQPINNPLLALQGRVPGLTIAPSGGLPGKEINIQIRGRNTLRNDIGGANPLVVIDGLPYDNTIPTLSDYNLIGNMSALSFVNPNDIESISVLKDADATSIYGSRGANGVILITTKKGKQGESGIILNVQTGVSDVERKLDLMNTEQYLTMRREALKNDGRPGRLDNPSFAGTYPDLMLWDQSRYTDWQKVILGGNGKFTDVQASINGSGSNIQYNLGGNFHRETTVFPGENSDQKGDAHFSLTGYSNNKKFKATFTASYLANNSMLPGIDLTEYIFREPNSPAPLNPDGSVNWALYPATGLAPTVIYEPYTALQLRKYRSNIKNLISAANLSYLLGSFRFQVNMGYGNLTGNSVKNIPSSSIDPSLFAGQGDLVRSSRYSNDYIQNWSIEPQINYNLKVGNGRLEALIGASLQTNQVKTDLLELYGYSSDELLGSQDAASFVRTKSNTSTQYKYSAIFGRFGYNYKDKYLLNVSVRRDGSSRFGPENQFGNFASIGAGWIFKEEEFLRSFSALSFGKFRFSYGSSGNDGIGDYKYLELYTPIGTYPYQDIKGYSSSGLYNPYYHWEATRKVELGLDLGFFKDRIYLNTAFYRNRSSNQLLNYPIPGMAGYGSFMFNQPALVENRGIEFVLTTQNLKRKFSWSSSLNFSANRNKLIKYSGHSAYVEVAKNIEGLPYYNFANTYQSAGVDPTTGLYQFRNKSGNIVAVLETSEAPDFGKYNRVSFNPEFYGGVSNSLSYKGITLDFLIQFTKQLGKNPLTQFTSYPGTRYNQFSYIDGKQWQPGKTDAEFMKYSTTGKSTVLKYWNESNIGFVDASFIRLKNVSLSYNLQHVIGHKFAQARIFVQGQNLYTIAKYKGFDPETQSLTALPQLRTLTVGFQLGF